MRKQEFFALQDINSGSILVCSPNYQTLHYMTEFLIDTSIQSFFSKNIFDRLFIRNLVSSAELFNFTISKSKSFPVRIKNPDASMKLRSEMAAHKYAILSEMYNVLELRRVRFSQKKTLAYQEFIYREKANQARLFLEKACPEGELFDYLYVKQYAEYKNISYKESAERILAKSKMGESLLARTELQRLKHFNNLKHAHTKEEMDKALEEFRSDLEL